MDLEHLTKHQIVLLTLLVSFMTSIATGIVTVSLMNQAPPGVTRTINQIVEHTVEKVVPAQGAAAASVTTEKTVVVKDDDLAASSIATVQKALVRITAKGDDKLIARGVIIDGKGRALTDRAALADSGATAFDAILPDGTRVPVLLPAQSGEKATSTPLIEVTVAVGTSTAVMPASLVDPSKLKLGQTVIRIGGVGADTVGEGVIATLPSGSTGDNTPLIEASVSSATPGSVIITLFGEVIGLSTINSQTQGDDFYSIAALPASTATSTPATAAS